VSVDANEIVESREQRDRPHVVLDLLWECIRQSGKVAHVHPHVQVLPLSKRRADMLGVRVAFDRRLDRSGAFGRAVAALHALRRSAVNLHNLSVVNVATECALDRLQIRPMAIVGKLDAVGEPGAQMTLYA
jgi:hypothetical protein